VNHLLAEASNAVSRMPVCGSSSRDETHERSYTEKTRTMRTRLRVVLVIAAAVCAARPTSGQSDQAARVVGDMREAVGGDAKLTAIKTFVVTGRVRQVRGDNLVPIEFEIQAELPDKFARRDEFPAQDAGPTVTGFNGDRYVQSPAPQPPPARPGGPPPPTPEQLQAQARAQLVNAKQDFARLMLGLFAASYPSHPLTFAYVGQAEAPQGRADVLDVKGPGDFAARLFVDGKTHLPVMLSWQARQPPARGRGPAGRPGGPPPAGAAPPAAGGPPSPAPGGPPPAVENRLYFAEYRSFDGLQLPTRIRRAVAGDTTEETTFDRFRINARVDPRRFEPGS
jgi:hypothetical protein